MNQRGPEQSGRENRPPLSRRDFLKLGSLAGFGLLVSACGPDDVSTGEATPASTPTRQGPSMTPMPTVDQAAKAGLSVVVIGGGIAGLTAAYLLRDYSVTVLEQGDSVGGRTLSDTYQGFTYAKGTEYLGEPEGGLRKVIRSLDIEPVEIPAPMDARFYDGKFYYGEEGLALMYIEHSSLEDLNKFIEAVQTGYRKYEDATRFDPDSELAELDQMTAREWFDQNEFADIFYDTYNVAARGLFGANLDEISALSSLPEFAYDFEGVQLLDEEYVALLSNSPEKTGERTDAYTFVTGITEVTDGLARELGDRIKLNATVTGVEQEEDGYKVTYQGEDGRTYRISSDQVILAVPAPVALELASSILDDEKQEILAQIPYAPYITVALFSDEPIFSQAFDLAVPDGYFFTDIYDSTWVQRHYDEQLADKPDSIMGIYIGPDSYQDGDLLEMSDEEVLESVYEDLEKVFPGVRERIVGHDIQRFPYAYPVLVPGAYERLSRLDQANRGSLLLSGDYTIYPTFEAAADSGRSVARLADIELKKKISE